MKLGEQKRLEHDKQSILLLSHVRCCLAMIDLWPAWLSREKATRHEEEGGCIPECDYLTNSTIVGWTG